MTLTDKTRPALAVPYAMEQPDRVPSRRYYDPEFYAMECELLWPHVWQMACRLAEIPNPGDFVEYQILDKSIIVVRMDQSTVRAYHNACRHRGVQLVKDRGHAPSGFTCPFHGWCYGLNGDNTWIYQPDLFDRSNIDPADVALTPCRVEIANGCAWINLDDHAPGLRESIEPFASTFDAWKAESLWPEWHLSCRMPVNWKLAMEAFMEGYHVRETHPQLFGPISSHDIYRDLGGEPPSHPQPQAGNRERRGRLAARSSRSRSSGCAWSARAWQAKSTRRTSASPRACAISNSRRIPPVPR